MNLLEIRTRLRRRVGSPDATDVTDASLNEFINTAYRDIASRFRFHKVRKLCTFDTIASTSRYGLPTDCEVVLRLRDQTTGMKLRKEDDSFEAGLEGVADTVEGVPASYLRQRDWVKISPVPDGVYTIEVFYKAGITDLVNDTDSPVIPASWHEGIVKLARHGFYDDAGDVPKAQYALQNYASWLSTKSIEVDEEKVDMDKGVRIPSLSRPYRRDYPYGYDFDRE